ncbi:hypothetical protein TSAR_008724 [Trichomalopsis sarcophagae]|uniref:Uncharacterized protein n=1 Tax=Trichomalopsis sarcophagae TaxID=543379 RepID=A0A232EG56_9HYME|nr:hypothetical protein TSAR_008724 [Trichomalopsis sarcophagae]
MSRRVQCDGSRGATTECLPCKPEDLGSSPGSVTFSLHSSLVTVATSEITTIWIHIDILGIKHILLLPICYITDITIFIFL